MAKKQTLVEQARDEGGRPHEPAAAQVPDRQSFPTRYAGLRTVGYHDAEIARQMGITTASLLRQLRRHSAAS